LTSKSQQNETTTSANGTSHHNYSQAVKRKSSDHAHHVKTSGHKLHTSSSSGHLYQHKPVYSEMLSSKCVVFIYYRGDLAVVVDDHFKKSFNANSKHGPKAVSSLTKSKLAQSIKSGFSNYALINFLNTVNLAYWSLV
jgi:hypothetical protein